MHMPRQQDVLTRQPEGRQYGQADAGRVAAPAACHVLQADVQISMAGWAGRAMEGPGTQGGTHGPLRLRLALPQHHAVGPPWPDVIDVNHLSLLRLLPCSPKPSVAQPP
jgi:hypothetical protein